MPVTIVLDLIHVLEYLWSAAYVFHPEGSPEAEAWVTERLLWLLCGDAGQVIASIRRTATCRGLTEVPFHSDWFSVANSFIARDFGDSARGVLLPAVSMYCDAWGEF